LDNVSADVTGSVTVADSGAGVPNAVVFVDADNDGLLSLGEQFASTDANGDYTLFDLSPGSYTLRTSFPPGYPCLTGCDGYEIQVDILGEVQGPVDFTTGFEFDGSGDPNSPVHGIVPGFHLGQFVSGDPTVDDNDGVFFLTGLNAGQLETIGITAAQPAVSPGYLNAWIDFNGDGIWSDSEQIFFDERLDDGFNARQIMVPANASATDAAARFRWTFERGVTPFEDAIAGETEDYIISVPMDPMSGLRAVDDVATVDEDTEITIDVLANDEAGPLGASFVIESLGTPSNGTATVVEGEVLYTPDANFAGEDEFGYTIIDTDGTRSSAVVNVTVIAINDPPTAVDDEVTVRVASRFNPIDVLANDFDVDGDLLMITSASADIGSVSVEGDQLLYTPPASLLTDATATITYMITDGIESAEAMVTVNISADQLVAFDLELFDTQGNLITEITEDENFQLRVSVRDLRSLVDREGVFSAYLDVLFDSSLVTSISDVDFTGSVYTEAQSGTVGSGIIDEVGAIASADPDPAPIGPDTQFLFAVDFVAANPGLATFTGNGADSPLHPVTLFGEDGALPEVLVQFNAGSLNIVPITKANDDVFVMNEDEANDVLRTFDVLDNDNFSPDVEPISIIDVSAVSPAGAGTVTVVGDRVRFDPTENFYGDVEFTYTLQDTAGVQSSALVTVTVTEVNDLPAPVDDEFSILRGGTSIVLDVLSNDIANNPDIANDPDDPPLETLSLVDIPPTMTIMGGTVTITDDVLTYSPPTAGNPAQDTFTYEVTDGRGGTATGNVTINFIEQVAAFDLSIVDRSNNPLSGPLAKGDEFYVVVTAEDLQTPAVGVFSAYIDLFYTANVTVDATADVVFNNTNYPGGQNSGDTSVAGLIDEIGAISVIDQLGAGVFEVFRVPFVSLAAGDAVFTADFADQPINAVTLILGGEAVALAENNINFGTTSITVENPVGAQGDTADVVEDTVDNVIRVLDNDLGSVAITAVGTPDRGGSVTIDGDTILYTPATDFNGIETFTYTAVDAAGNECLALVTVTVTDRNDAPVAVPDERGVPVNSSENLFDLLENDTDMDPGVGGELTITLVDGQANEATTTEGGTVTIGDDGAFVLYTPAAGFMGTDTFTYTVADGLGETSTTTVTVNVSDPVDRPIVNYSFEFLGMDGFPLTTVDVGDTFLMNVFVEDVREISLGVFAAYLDVTWTGGVSVDGDFNDLQFNEELFPNQQRGTVDNGLNEIDELGATYGDIVPPPELCPDPSSCRQLLVTVPLIADGPGLVQFTGNPAEGPAPGSPLHHTLVLERSTQVPNSQIDYSISSITVAGNALTRTNFVNPFDVDANGAVSPIDALLVINELNTVNGASLLQANQAMTDVNADGYVSPLDALLVINQLGATPQAPLSGAVTAGDADEAPADLTAPSNQAVLMAIDSIFVDEEEASSDNDLDTVMELIARDAQRDN
ncbi:MAG: Ig-like domain-containing protein, partial [Planctomycetota bacterium]